MPVSLAAGDLFQLLRDGGGRTRSELADLTGLARSTIAARVDELIASGLVAAAGEARSSGGRPPTRFAFDPHSRVVLAADLGATHATLAVTDLGAAVIGELAEPINIADGPEHVLTRLWTIWSKILGEAGRTADDVAGVGIGVPGPVEFATGRPTNPPIMPGWDGFDVPHYIQRSFDTHVVVDNDVNIMALGERAFFWPDVDSLLFIKVATGIGAGIISGGLLQRGADGTAGDIGHVRVPRGDGLLCRCGNYGCLEALASGPAVAAALTAEGVPAATGEDVVQLARHGNVKAVQAMRQAGRDVGDVLATCVNLLNPSVIVIGGALAAGGEHLLAGVREVVYQRSLPLATARLRIVQSMAADQAGVLGASRLVVDDVLSPASIEALLEKA